MIGKAFVDFLKYELVTNALGFAARMHAGQLRKYHGDPYILHPLRVADAFAAHELATGELVAVALLHDVMEDCGVSVGRLGFSFGIGVSIGVEALTNTSKLVFPRLLRAERKQMDRDRISKVVRPYKVLKLFDRLDNLRDLPEGEKFARVYVPESRALVEVLRDADPALAELVLAECDRHEIALGVKDA